MAAWPPMTAAAQRRLALVAPQVPPQAAPQRPVQVLRVERLVPARPKMLAAAQARQLVAAAQARQPVVAAQARQLVAVAQVLRPLQVAAAAVLRPQVQARPVATARR